MGLQFLCGGMSRTLAYLSVGVEQAGQPEGGCGRDAADDDGLEGAFEDARAEEFALDGSEDSERQQGDDDGDFEREVDVGKDEVGRERDEAADDVGKGD